MVSRDQIIDKIWGEDSYPSHRTVDNYIVGLRKWSETDPKSVEISTVRGIGYRMDIKG
jgi:two-component system alkaline phosphatase synthesis response regulator PhoP